MPLYFRFRHSCLPQKTLTLMIQTATRVHRLHHRLHHSAPLLTHRFTLTWCDVPCSLLQPLATVTEYRHVRSTATHYRHPPASLTATHACQPRTSSTATHTLTPQAPTFTPHPPQPQPPATHGYTSHTSPSTAFLNHSPLLTTAPSINHTSDDSETPFKAAADAEAELTEHVNILFLQTVEQNNLSSDVTHGLRELLTDHSDTFAKLSTDLGHCELLQRDIDTGVPTPHLSGRAHGDPHLQREMRKIRDRSPWWMPRPQPVCESCMTGFSPSLDFPGKSTATGGSTLRVSYFRSCGS